MADAWEFMQNPKQKSMIQRELHCHAEIGINHRIRGGRNQRRIPLTVIIEAESQHATHGIIGRERPLDGTVATRGLRLLRGNVAAESILIAERDV
jgi:hypothetical protein